MHRFQDVLHLGIFKHLKFPQRGTRLLAVPRHWDGKSKHNATLTCSLCAETPMLITVGYLHSVKWKMGLHHHCIPFDRLCFSPCGCNSSCFLSHFTSILKKHGFFFQTFSLQPVISLPSSIVSLSSFNASLNPFIHRS